MIGRKSRQKIERMCGLIAHRGPDESGIYEDRHIVLGHTRLSVIDLVTGRQPIHNEDETIWVAYNGEIYNFPDIREELEQRGHRFYTKSDTEILVHLYEEEAEGFLDKLDGIFAFALWDVKRQRLLLARDYFGVKPLHYYYDGKRLVFCSEIKGILADDEVKREVEFQSLHYFLNLRYIPGEYTLFKNIKRLLAGHYLLYENGNLKIERYWDYNKLCSNLRKNDGKSENDYIEGIRALFRNAVKKQLISDVPLGVYLSGGMDSSSILAVMSSLVDRPVKTFSLGFDEPTDELDDARFAAEYFGTEHHEIILEPDPLRYMPEVMWYVEEPKINILQGYLLANFAKQHVKVVHGGLGGDELFAGYVNNRYIYPTQKLHHLIPEWLASRVLPQLSSWIFQIQNQIGALHFDEYRRGAQMLLSIGNPERYYLILRNVWDYDAGNFQNLYADEILRKNFLPVYELFEQYFRDSNMPVIDRVLLAEFQTKMVDDFLLNEDRVSMANGLEVRVPFLDRDLVEFAFSIPVGLKMKSNQTKYIFRKAMSDLLPPRILSKKKWGFTFSSYHQFRKDLKFVAERVLTERRIVEQGIFNYNYLRKIIDYPPHPKLRWHYFMLWMIVGFQIWHEMFITGESTNPEFALEAYYG